MEDEPALFTPTRSLEIEDFWKHFRLFSTPFENICFHFWHFALLGFIVLLAILDIVLDLRQGIDLSFVLTHDGNFHSLLKGDLTNAQLFSEGIALVLVGITFSRWQRSVPVLFRQLYETGRICSVGSATKVDQKEYLLFLEKYQLALNSRKRYIFLSILTLIMLGVIGLVIIPRNLLSSLGSDWFHRYCQLMEKWKSFSKKKVRERKETKE